MKNIQIKKYLRDSCWHSTTIAAISYKAKTALQNYWSIYLITITILVIMRTLSRTTDSDMLLWILTPTTRWVSVLSGIPFEYLPHMGYVNHAYQFLIAPSCSGSRFMLLTFLMLIFSFLYQIQKKTNGFLWLGFSLLFSYASTILVNGIRITVSIFLPIFLEKRELMNGWLTPNKLHTMLGTSIYFLSLCLIYLFSAAICRVISQKEEKTGSGRLKGTSKYFTGLITPAFWYLLIVLALPFLKRIYHREWDGFGQYAVLILSVCLTILTILHSIRLLRRNK